MTLTNRNSQFQLLIVSLYLTKNHKTMTVTELTTEHLSDYTAKCMTEFILNNITQTSASTRKEDCAEQSIFSTEILDCDIDLTYSNSFNEGYDTAFINTKTKMLYTRTFKVDLKDMYLNNKDITKLFIQKIARINKKFNKK
jgi:hypothetical protein